MPPKRICVIGAGVIGLATALRLRQSGHNVAIVAESAAGQGRVTSPVAAAFWHPFQVHEPSGASWTIRQLAERTLERLLMLMAERGARSAIVLQHGEEYFDEQSAAANSAPPWWAEQLELEFRRLREHKLPPPSETLGRFVAGTAFRLPVVHMGGYLAGLREEVESIGVDGAGRSQPSIVTGRRITSLDELTDAHGGAFDAIVNCAGIGAAPLAGDRLLHPLQGQIVVAPQETGLFDRCPKLRFTDAGAFAREPVYVVPRATHRDVVLGGTVVDLARGSSLDAGFDEAADEHWTPDPAKGRRILARCAALEPAVAGFNPTNDELAHRFMAVGLRPARAPLRIESDRARRVPVIHNYGHGGAGLTLHWGSALEVERLLAEVC